MLNKEKILSVLYIFIIILIVSLMVLSFFISKTLNDSKHYPTIVVEGNASVYYIPYQANLLFTIGDTNKDVSIASKSVKENVNSLYSVLKEEFSIDEKDIKTENYAIHPEYNYIKGKRNLIGYSVKHQTKLKIRDLDMVGKILDKISFFSPISVSQLSFDQDMEDLKRLEEEAVILAINDAKESAKRIKQESQFKLGRIVNVRIVDDYNRPHLYSKSLSSFETADYSTPIELGENKIEKKVFIDYQVKK